MQRQIREMTPMHWDLQERKVPLSHHHHLLVYVVVAAAAVQKTLKDQLVLIDSIGWAILVVVVVLEVVVLVPVDSVILQ
jgi:hypothetical protein